MIIGLGAVPSTGGAVPTSSLTSIGADLYGQAAYGTLFSGIPTLETMNAQVNPATGELTTDFGSVGQAIQNAIDSGDYNPSGNIPINASGNFSTDPSTWVVWILGGVVVYVALKI
jgi:hypothetical protein